MHYGRFGDDIMLPGTKRINVRWMKVMIMHEWYSTIVSSLLRVKNRLADPLLRV